MASEVAPCMPLQLFRRAAGGRRPRPQEVCRRLTEDLNSLAALSGGSTALGSGAPPPAAAGATAPATGSGAAAPPALPGPPSSGGGEPQRDSVVRTLSEDVQKQLHTVLEVLEEAAERGERAACNGGGGGGGDHPPESAGEFLTQFLAADLPLRLVTSLGELEFEVRKDVISVFSAIVRLGSQLGADQQIQEYARNRPSFFRLLVDGYGRAEIATHCGMMLRSCARHRRLVEAFLNQPEVAIRLLSFTSHGSFDVSSDAFSSLHDFLLTHKVTSAVFLEANFHEFFRLYNSLLQSDDYVTQRQALKLLSEMLLDRTFMRVMLMYIGDEQFLQIHMNLLRADSKAIQFEAFHVFKIFVANPQKPPRVQQILYKNKDKLVKLLETLRPSRQDDKQFAEDRSTVVGKLQALEPPPPKAAGTVSSPSVAASGGGGATPSGGFATPSGGFATPGGGGGAATPEGSTVADSASVGPIAGPVA